MLLLVAPLVLPAEGTLAQGLKDGAEQENFDVQLTPTPEPVVRRMLELGGAGPHALVADLGSGDGRIPIAAARDFGARGFGFEINKRLLAVARANAETAGVAERVTFHDQDLFEADLSEVTLLTLYLLPSMNLRLRQRILLQMRPGARVVAHEYGLGGWLPDHKEMVQGSTILLWVVPAAVEGSWRVETGESAFDINIKQTYQEIEGTARVGGRTVMPLLDTRLRGNEIGFTIESVAGGRQTFIGSVEGDVMIGVPDPQLRRWRAQRK